MHDLCNQCKFETLLDYMAFWSLGILSLVYSREPKDIDRIGRCLLLHPERDAIRTRLIKLFDSCVSDWADHEDCMSECDNLLTFKLDALRLSRQCENLRDMCDRVYQRQKRVE